MKKDPKDYILKFQSADKMGSMIEHKIISISDSECLSEYQASENHFNPGGILHGGALFAAMDSSQGALVHYALDEKFRYAVTGTATVKYLAPVKNEKVQIRSWFHSTQDRKLFVHSLAKTESGTEVAKLEEIWISAVKS